MGVLAAENRCPVCGLDLGFPPWNGDSPSDEICPCCFIQFGYDDAVGEDAQCRAKVYANWRAEWIAAGMPWRGRGRPSPEDWDPSKQVEQVR
jgi:predicted amidophosphoribosyltransferase